MARRFRAGLCKGPNELLAKGFEIRDWGLLPAAVMASFLATPVAGLIRGAMGLHGAAAVSAGLAFLGGGFLAAGGLGVVRGLMDFVEVDYVC